MAAVEREQRVPEVKVAIRLYGLLSRVPESKEINRAFLPILLMRKVEHGLHTEAEANLRLVTLNSGL